MHKSSKTKDKLSKKDTGDEGGLYKTDTTELTAGLKKHLPCSSELTLITVARLVTGSLSLCTKSTRGDSRSTIVSLFFVGDNDEGGVEFSLLEWGFKGL